MIKLDDIVYVFKFNKIIETSIVSIIETSIESIIETKNFNDNELLYIVELNDPETNFPYGLFGLYRNEIFTKKDLRKQKMKRLIK